MHGTVIILVISSIKKKKKKKNTKIFGELVLVNVEILVM